MSAGGNLFEALKPFQDVFLFVDDLALNLSRGGAGPNGADFDDRFAHVRRQLDRDRGQRQNAEHHGHQDDGDHRDGAFDGETGRVHHLAP